MLPEGVSGQLLAKLLQADHTKLPVLFMSGYPKDAIVHDGRLDEGVNFLEKPFTSEVLLAKVREVLDAIEA